MRHASDQGRALSARTTALAASPAYARTVMDQAVFGRDPDTGRLYGIDTVGLTWVYSDDAATWTSTGVASSVPVNGKQELVFHGDFMYVTISNGTLHRAPRGEFATWTDVSVATRPAGTTGRVGVLASNGTHLFYGNYNNDPLPVPQSGAFIWRSANNGDTWSLVFASANARHVHNINPDPDDPTVIWSVLGDSGWDDGLIVSTDGGASFDYLVRDRYAIDVVFQQATGNVRSRLLMEGDGSAEPHVVQYPRDRQSSTITSLVPVPSPDWAGTARCLTLTSEGNAFYASTAEGGATGSKDGFWLSHGPYFNTAVLLEDLTGNVPVFYGRTYEVGPYLVNYRSRITRPKFVGQ